MKIHHVLLIRALKLAAKKLTQNSVGEDVLLIF